jgi:glycosyltransferase involved in cell wall biosynthesis
LCHDPVFGQECEFIDANEKSLCLNDKGTLVTVCRRVEDYARIANAAVLEFRPEIIVFSESQTYRNLDCLPRKYLKRSVITVHCTEILPFGPFSILLDNKAANLIKAAGGVLTVSQFLRNYLFSNGGIESVVLPFPGYGPGPFPFYGCFHKGLVLMVNLSEVKGLPILIDLARAFPDVEFGAVRSWATTDSDADSIGAISTIRIIDAHPNIDTILNNTRILVVPSLCQEAFGVTVIEAMLRGIPVIASQIGGLPEAKLGTKFSIPVNPIREWEYGFNATGILMKPKVPPQDMKPWIEALRALLCDRQEYESLSIASRQTALDFVQSIRVEAFEEYFAEVLERNLRH